MTHDKPCAEGCHGTPADTERPNPMGPHVQVITGWLDDNGCLLPDPDGIAYRRTFSEWEQVPDGD